MLYTCYEPRVVLIDTPFYEYIDSSSKNQSHKSAFRYIGNLKFMHPDVTDEELVSSYIAIKTASVISMMVADGFIEVCSMVFRSHLIVSSTNSKSLSDSHYNTLYHYMAYFGIDIETITKIYELSIDNAISDGTELKTRPSINDLTNYVGYSPVDIIYDKSRLHK